MRLFNSLVEGHEGECSPTWFNRNHVYLRLDRGISGFFKNTKKVFFGLITVKTGDEFHGVIQKNGDVI